MVDNSAPAVVLRPAPKRRVCTGNRVVLAFLRSPLRGLFGALLVLRYSARDGHLVMLPVAYVPSEQGFVVLVGGSAGKQWWRHFVRPAAVEVWWHGGWQQTSAHVVPAGTPEHRDAMKLLPTRRAGSPGSTDDPLVLITAPPPVLITAPGAGGPAPSAWQVWRSWTGWVTAGEFVGFSVPAGVAALVAGSPAGWAAAILIAAGAAEGGVLGLAQSHVLRRTLPGVNSRRWVVATAAGASLAWAIGLVPMLTDGRIFDLPLAIVIPALAVLGSVLLASIGTAQWLVLRGRVDRAAWWILTTAAAWTAGLAVFAAVTTPLWQPGQPALLVVAIGILGGLVMAGTVGALTGWAVVRLFRT